MSYFFFKGYYSIIIEIHFVASIKKSELNKEKIIPISF